MSYSPGLKNFAGKNIDETWKKNILSVKESKKFSYGYWDLAINEIEDPELKKNLLERFFSDE